MPSLGRKISPIVVVADEREGQFLVVNNRDRRWCVGDERAVAALERGDLVPGSFDPVPRSSVCEASGFHLYVIYKLTDRCNFGCTYCYDARTLRPRDRSARNRSIREVLDRVLVEKAGRVSLLFHGGEPLLEFEEIQALVNEYSAYWPNHLQFSIQTNFSRITPEMASLFRKYNVGISVSVDGIDARANSLRVSTSEDHAYALVRRKIAEIPELGASEIGLLLTVGQHNVASVPSALLGFQLDGFRSVSLSFMHSVSADAHQASPTDIVEMFVQICGLITEGRLHSLAVWSLIEWIRRVISGTSELVCANSPCGAGRSLVTIFPSGEVGPCDSIFDDRYYRKSVAGYFHELEAEGAGSLFQGLLARNVEMIEPCRSCDVRAFCNGTCPGNVILEKGSLTGVANHECTTNYEWIRELMWHLVKPGIGEKLLRYSTRHIQDRKAQRREH